MTTIYALALALILPVTAFAQGPNSQLATCYGTPPMCEAQPAPPPLAPTAPPTDPHAPFKHATHLVIASSTIAHFADLSTTSWAMGVSSASSQKYREANPVLRPFAGDPVALALAKGGLAVAMNYYLLRMHERKPKTVLLIGIAQTLAVGYVAHRNAQALGLRGR